MFRFTPQTIPSNIFVIGGGGTGSRLMPLLTQFIRSITRGVNATGWLESPTIWVVDDDIVETKNLLRQNFAPMDVGKHKATVLAERYGRVYDVDVVAVTEKVDNTDKFYRTIAEMVNVKNSQNTIRARANDINSVFGNSMVIICVDSARARRDILNNFIRQKPGAVGGGCFFIDSGNEDSYGQVNFFNPTLVSGVEDYDRLSEERKIPKFVGSTIDINFLPMNVNYYRDLQNAVSTASCADLNQTLAINAMMATTIMSVVQNYYYRKQFTYNCVRLSLDGANMTEFLTFNTMKRSAIKHEDFTAYVYSYSKSRATESNGDVTYMTCATNCINLDFIDSVYSPLKAELTREEEIARRKQREAEAAEKAKAKLAEMNKSKLGALKESLQKKHGTKITATKEALKKGTTLVVDTGVAETTKRKTARKSEVMVDASQRVESLSVPDSWLTTDMVRDIEDLNQRF